ncbi:MAG: NMD3-related protein, partial [Promethearchaeota archaeon]
MPQNCPKCGRTPSEDLHFIEGFCLDCFFSQHPLVQLRHSPQAIMCPRCDAYRVSGQWVQCGDTSIDEHVFQMVCDLLDPLFAPKIPATYEIQLLD